MLEEQADEIDRLLNFLCKVDREQEERIQEEYVPYEQYEELLEENKRLRASRIYIGYRGARGSGKRYAIMWHPKNDASNDIRCKDCKHCYHNEQLNTYRCTHFNCIMKPDDYCSWGDKNED